MITSNDLYVHPNKSFNSSRTGRRTCNAVTAKEHEKIDTRQIYIKIWTIL